MRKIINPRLSLHSVELSLRDLAVPNEHQKASTFTRAVACPISASIGPSSTAHVCKDQAHFTSLGPSSGFFTGIGGVILPIRGFGSIMFQNDSNEYITVNNVAYVPDATKNLISVKVITGITGLRASFGPDDCILTDTPIGIYNSPNLHEFIYSVVIPNKSISDHHAFSANMHPRLGHPSPAVMKALGHKLPPEVKFCDHCLAGNMTRTLPKLATTKTTRPLQLLHVDICDPAALNAFFEPDTSTS